MESIFFTYYCSNTVTETRSVIADGTAYPGGERVYVLDGNSGHTDVSWTFPGLPVTALRSFQFITIVSNDHTYSYECANNNNVSSHTPSHIHQISTFHLLRALETIHTRKKFLFRQTLKTTGCTFPRRYFRGPTEPFQSRLQLIHQNPQGQQHQRWYIPHFSHEQKLIRIRRNPTPS